MKRSKSNNGMSEKLTSAEMGKLWAAYIGNTMGKCVLSSFLQHVQDTEIRKITQYALKLSDNFITEIKSLLDQANFPVPIGFTDKDRNLNAPRLFEDEFYLHYLQYTGKAGMSVYSAAIPLVTRKDIRDFFFECHVATSKLLAYVNDLMMKKGVLMNTPQVPVPKEADYIDQQNFLNGFIGKQRPLHGIEVAHLYGNLNNDVTSKALVTGFYQVAEKAKVKKYFERGNKLNQRHIELFTNKLSGDNLPSPTLLDHLVTTSTTPPFSEKLMMFHKIDMFSMKIREYANGASLNGRRDIGGMYAKCLMDVSLYVEDGANIMIENQWMEQPPLMVNRSKLASK